MMSSLKKRTEVICFRETSEVVKMNGTGKFDMADGNRKLILRVLKKEQCWLTFDELYEKAQAGCDWITFAHHLERLIKRGFVRYILPYGSDNSCFRISRRKKNLNHDAKE